MKISEIANRNFEAATLNTKTAREMALTPHNLSRDSKYARLTNGALYIWSDTRNAWVQIAAAKK